MGTNDKAVTISFARQLRGLRSKSHSSVFRPAGEVWLFSTTSMAVAKVPMPRIPKAEFQGASIHSTISCRLSLAPYRILKVSVALHARDAGIREPLSANGKLLTASSAGRNQGQPRKRRISAQCRLQVSVPQKYVSPRSRYGQAPGCLALALPRALICALREGESLRGELRRMAVWERQLKHVVAGAALTSATQDTATFTLPRPYTRSLLRWPIASASFLDDWLFVFLPPD